MAAKKSARKKKVEVVIDPETLAKLADAIDALSKIAQAWQMSAEDPSDRRALKKKGKKRR